MTEDVRAPTNIGELRKSFGYGSRSNQDFSFVHEIDDMEFGDFLQELFAAVSSAANTGDATSTVDVIARWQMEGYRRDLGDPEAFRYRYEDTPHATLAKPLSESRVALMTSSGHFVDGDDPKPLGVENMSQAEAEERIMEMLKEPPTLSAIPSDTPFDQLRVRHGGYPIAAAVADPQVVFPLRIMEALEADGTIGQFAETAYSFVGAAAQGPIKKTIAAQWADMFHEQQVDAVFLVPI